jgi:16S rRNA (guanine527-N7)-methyltransferase
MPDDDALVPALSAIQARGAIGVASIPGAIQHAEQFVRMVPRSAQTLADLGSGGGLPGLVIAVRCPDLRVVLVERRHTRADLLRRAVASLALGDRVTVVADDVKAVAERSPHSFDVVTARSFAAPAITARWAGALLRSGGVLIVSEPPLGDPAISDPARWPAAMLATHGLVDQGRDQGVRVLRRA